MSANDAATLIGGILVDIAVLWVAMNVRAIWRADRYPCLCGHRKNEHVSAFDWDSDYGDPQHRQPDYKKPGICRECVCRFYVPRRAA